MRCICCYNSRYPCGFRACPDCGGMASEDAVEDYGHCEDCEESNLREILRGYFRKHLYLSDRNLEQVVDGIMADTLVEDVRHFIIMELGEPVWGEKRLAG